MSDIIEAQRNKIAALHETLRGHRCPVDDRSTVAECVDGKHCGCCDGLLLVDQ